MDEYESVIQRLLGSKDVHIHDSKARWAILVLCALTMLGPYFCYDSLGPLQGPILESFGIDTSEFNSLYAFGLYAGMLTPFFGGLLIDKFGLPKVYIFFIFIATLGQYLVSHGANNLSMSSLMLGRALFVVGHENAYAAKSAMISKWFAPNQLAFAMGVTVCSSRIGSSLSSYFGPAIYMSTKNVASPLYFGFYLCLLSLIASIGIYVFDVKAEEKDFHQNKVSEVFQLSDVKKLSKIYYLQILNIIFIYGVLFGFLMNCSHMMTQRFGFGLEGAGKCMTLIFVVATFSLLPISYYVDKIGKKIHVILFSSVFLSALHFYTAHLSNTYDHPNYWIIVTLIGAGLGYGIYASVCWPTLALTVEEKVRGTAFGLCATLQNFGLAVAIQMIGWVHDATIETDHGYYWTEMFLVFLAVLGYIAGYLILIEDRLHGNVLNSVTLKGSDNYTKMNTEDYKEIEMQKV